MKTRWRGPARITALIALVPFLTSCVAMVSGPSMPVFAGQGKNPMQFESDRAQCHAQAISDAQRVQEAANANAALAILGTAALGAALGAAAGGGRGAGIGAAAGGVAGGAFGASGASSAPVQRAYDTTYFSCMYNRGHQVPGVAPVQQQAPRAAPMPPPPPTSGAPSYAPPPAAAPAPMPPPPAASSEVCVPTGRSVKIPGGYAPECK